MLKIYARYIYTNDLTASAVGNKWHEVTDEYNAYTPSGLHHFVVINGIAVKECHCEVVQVVVNNKKITISQCS